MDKKVLVISNFHENNAISRSNIAFNYFCESGFVTNVIYASFSHSLRKQRYFINKNYYSIPTISYSGSISIRRILSYVKFSMGVYKHLNKNNYDIIYINIPPNILSLAVLAKMKSAKLIIDIVDLWPESLPSKRLKHFVNIFSWLITFSRTRAINKSNFTITQSNYFSQKLNLEKLKNSGTVYLKKINDTYPNIKSITDELSILYIGNISMIYDFDSLLKILHFVKKRRPVVLHILGMGPFQDILFKQLSQYGIPYTYHGVSFDENVKRSVSEPCWFGFNGYKSTTEVALSYKSIDYLSFGVPLINSAKGDTFSLVDKNNIGFNYDNYVLDLLIEKLSLITKQQVKRMKNEAYKTFDEKFSYHSYAREMDALLFKNKCD